MLNNKNLYEFNKGTLAILPNGKESSLIYEDDSRYIIDDNPLNIMEDSCKYFGSSYVGRYEGAKNILGVSYKLPIIIEETQELIFFPTNSPRLDNCSWISLKNINNYIKNDNKVLVNFKNGINLEFDLSIFSFENQIFRALRLENILKTRKLIQN